MLKKIKLQIVKNNFNRNKIYIQKRNSISYISFFYSLQDSLCMCLKISMQFEGCLFFQFSIPSNVSKEALISLHTPYHEKCFKAHKTISKQYVDCARNNFCFVLWLLSLGSMSIQVIMEKGPKSSKRFLVEELGFKMYTFN